MSIKLNYQIARRALARRLAANISRKTLAQKSDVPESTIRRFESSGEVSLSALLKIAMALGALDEFDALFPESVPASIEEVRPVHRKRGRS